MGLLNFIAGIKTFSETPENILKSGIYTAYTKAKEQISKLSTYGGIMGTQSPEQLQKIANLRASGGQRQRTLGNYTLSSGKVVTATPLENFASRGVPTGIIGANNYKSPLDTNNVVAPTMLDKVRNFVQDNLGIGIAGGAGAVIGGIGGYVLGKSKSTGRKSHRKPKKRKSIRRSTRKHTRTVRHKKSRSKRGIHYTKKGQPYKIMANGRARFVKGKRRRR